MSISSSSHPQRPDPAEMRATLFKAGDSDGNGTLSKAEFTMAMENMPKPAGGHGGPRSASANDATQAAPAAEDIFTQMDADTSGEVTQDEMKAFDEARQAERESRRNESFEGAGELLKKILEQLSAKSGGSGDSTADTQSAETDTKTSTEELIAQLISKLQERNPTYQANGNATGSEGVGLFTRTV